MDDLTVLENEINGILGALDPFIYLILTKGDFDTDCLEIRIIKVGFLSDWSRL